MLIQVRRGLEANRLSYTPESGEITFTTDEKKLYVGDGSTPGGVEVDEGGTYDLQVDDTGTYTYLGNATPGAETSDSMWRIMRVTNATGVTTHASGNSLFNKKWDSRYSYPY